METCPKYIRYKIANELSHSDLLKLFNVNKWWHNAGKDDAFWRIRIKKIYGMIPENVIKDFAREYYEKNFQEIYSIQEKYNSVQDIYYSVHKPYIYHRFINSVFRTNANVNYGLDLNGSILLCNSGKHLPKTIGQNCKKLVGIVSMGNFIYIDTQRNLIINFKKNFVLAKNVDDCHISENYNVEEDCTQNDIYYVSDNDLYVIEDFCNIFRMIQKGKCRHIRAKKIGIGVKRFIMDLKHLMPYLQPSKHKFSHINDENYSFRILYINTDDFLCFRNLILAHDVKNAYLKTNTYKDIFSCNILDVVYLDINDTLSILENFLTRDSYGNVEISTINRSLISTGVKKYIYADDYEYQAQYMLLRNGNLYIKGGGFFGPKGHEYFSFSESGNKKHYEYINYTLVKQHVNDILYVDELQFIYSTLL